MKKEIHPEFYMNIQATCASCGAKHEVSSTMPEINMEVCSKCHPFYTGDSKIMDTAGRAERFRARVKAAEPASKKTAKKVKKSEA